MVQARKTGAAGGARFLVVLILLTGHSALCAHPAGGEEIQKVRLDPMNTDYMGMDFNDDGMPDFLRMNVILGEHTIYLGQPGGRPLRVDGADAADGGTDILPDLFREIDLDGDKVKDLLILNRRQVRSCMGNDRALLRLLEQAVYPGVKGGTFRDLRSSDLGEEQAGVFLEKAKALLLLEPGLSGSAPSSPRP